MSEMSFNDKLKRLEQIVSVLEKGEASLEQSLELFEEGSKLTKECSLILDNASLKIKQFDEQRDNTNE